MSNELPPLTKGINRDGVVEYHFWADQTWDGFDSIVKYLVKHWNGLVTEESDEVYTRRKVVRVEDVPITVKHDSQMGNYFFREDGVADQSVLEKIEADLLARLSPSP
ncbi:hypothetical protein [Paraburkholderia phenazinium]|uniref:hypothetical protein n=1 Tax=Paraburkholderia phenazinium TaxID=60549 RepID=UPI00158D54F4|nr:hypothetical protein [Paraburkholderia phenazinium]